MILRVNLFCFCRDFRNQKIWLPWRSAVVSANIMFSKNKFSNVVVGGRNSYEIGDDDDVAFKLFGIGGNFMSNKKLFDKPIGGRAGKIWSTLHQFGALYKNLEHKSQPSIFVSHVSPGKEPLLARLITHFFPNIWLSGHMGAPYTCVWNEFTIRVERQLGLPVGDNYDCRFGLNFLNCLQPL